MEWGEYHFDPHKKYRVDQCMACQAGEPGITCMKDSEPDGLCPVADKSPILLSSNQMALEIYRQAQGSAKQVNGERKVYVYLLVGEIEALMNIHEVPPKDRPLLVDKIKLLEDLANHLRRGHRKAGKR